MDRFLLYDRRGHVTAKNLAERLGIPCGKDMPDERQDYLIRWGTSDRINYVPEIKTYNLRKAIAANTDKFDALRKMDENGVPVPNHSRNWQNLSFPMIGRGNNHMGGRDTVLYLQPQDIEVKGPSDYYLEYIPKSCEYRTHVIDDSIVKISEKRFTQPAGDEEYDPVVWNYDTGWTFHHPGDTHAGAYMALAAVGAMGLDFGAVDVIISSDGDPYILEVNTCPGLDEPSLDVYEEEFKRLLEIED